MNKANDDGVTPLYYASCNGHLEVVRALLDARRRWTRPIMTVDSLCLGLLTMGTWRVVRVSWTRAEVNMAITTVYSTAGPLDRALSAGPLGREGGGGQGR